MSERAKTLRRLAAATGFVSELSDEVVDTALARAALEEQVAPLLGERASRGALTCSREARAVLVNAHLACVATERWAATTREPLLAALAARDVPAIWLKGGALVKTIYARPGMRTMSDLDVLVPASRWNDAQQAFASVGGVAARAEALVVGMKLNHERAWAMPHGATVDLHRRLAPWPLFHVDHAGVFARARALPTGGFVPAPEDLFVSLALHAAQDGFALPLRAVIDGLALVASETITSVAVVERARSWGASRATAAWLRVLVTHGLARHPWLKVALELDPDECTDVTNLPREVPRDSAPGAPERWRARWQLVRTHDEPGRPMVFFAYRAVLRAGDRARAHVPFCRARRESPV